MKVTDILKENDERKPTELTDDDYKAIINSKFFKLNIEPNIDNDLRAERNLKNIGKKVLLHGTNQPIDYLRLDTKEIEDRKAPRDTPKTIHDMVNNKLEEKFGVRLRDKLFATNDFTIAKTFGKHVSVVIPSDDYTLYTSEHVNDFTFQIANKLIGIGSEFNIKFKDIFFDHVKGKTTALSKQFNNLEKPNQVTFVNNVLGPLIQYMQTIIVQHKGTVKDHYNILSYSSYDMIKDRIKDFINKYFKEDDVKSIRKDLLKNLDGITKEMINIANENISTYFSQLLNEYVESIYSFKEVPDGLSTKEIMIDASYGTFISIETLEKVLDYYVENNT